MNSVTRIKVAAITLAAGAMIALGVTAPANATVPFQNLQIAGTPTCNADGTYTVQWDVTARPWLYTLGLPQAIAPTTSTINYAPVLHGGFGTSFQQIRIPGLSGSAEAAVPIVYQGTVVQTLDGTVNLPACMSAAQIHALFTSHAAHKSTVARVRR